MVIYSNFPTRRDFVSWPYSGPRRTKFAGVTHAYECSYILGQSFISGHTTVSVFKVLWKLNIIW